MESNDLYELHDCIPPSRRQHASGSVLFNEDANCHAVNWNTKPRNHRTTSMHRNVAGKSGQQLRTLPRSLEQRRVWVEYSAGQNHTEVDHAAQIADRMEKDSALMQDNAMSGQLRSEALRAMPQRLTIKRDVKRKINRTVDQKAKQKPIGCCLSWRFSLSMKFTKLQNEVKSWVYVLEIWYSTLKHIEGHFGSGISSYFKFFRWMFLLNLFVAVMALCFVVAPQVVHQSEVTNQTNFLFGEIFTGNGYLTDTVLFYGHYSNDSLVINDSLRYKMPYAYFYTMLAMYVMFLIVIGSRMAESYRKSFIKTKGGRENVFAHKIFCGWDYRIANEDAANLKHFAAHSELKELLSDVEARSLKSRFLDKLWTACVRFASNAILLILMCATGYATWKLLDENRLKNSTESATVLTAVFINIIILVYPSIFSFISRYEDYKNPRVALYVNLARIFVLEMMVIGILITFWLIQSQKEICWETSLGQEVYRLIVLDFFFSVMFTLAFEVSRYVIYKTLWKGIGHQEFDIARHTLQLVYNQTLFWVGLFFSPMLAVVMIIKLFLMWYIRSKSVLMFCRPSARSWRAAQALTWFLILSFICLLAALSVLGYIIFYVKPSNCGPFRNYDAMVKAVLTFDETNTIWNVITYVFKPGAVALIFIALCCCVHYQRAKSKAQLGIVTMLREMLIRDAKDKQFLLAYISKVTKGQWHYNLQEGRADLYDPYKMLPTYRHDVDANIGDVGVADDDFNFSRKKMS